MSKSSVNADTETAFPPPSATNATQTSPSRRAKPFADNFPTTAKGNQISGFALPQSPSLPEINALRSHVRTNSDVQGLVKRFEHLDVRDRDAESVERRRKHEAELRRAQIAREEAESDVKRLREETRRLKRECDEGRERERKVGKRLEVVMEEFASTKEQHALQCTVYEKELRKARKEAYKSSSAVIKLQEELKSTRNTLRVTQSNFDLEKEKVQRREQETFNAQYQLAAMQEELEKLRAQLNVVQEEKAALKLSLKDEEVTRVAAEGRIALPHSQEEDDDLFSSPRRRSPLSDDKENLAILTSPKKLQSKRLEDDLMRERSKRQQAEGMIEFLNMECTFRCCRCQTSSKKQDHDRSALSIAGELAEKFEDLMRSMKVVLNPPHAVSGVNMTSEKLLEPAHTQETTATNSPVANSVQDLREISSQSASTNDLDRSMTFTADLPGEPTPVQDEEMPMAPQSPAALSSNEHEAEAMLSQPPQTIPLQPSSPKTPTNHHATPFRKHPSIRTVTTTTTVRLHFTPVSKPAPHHEQLLQDTAIAEDVENIPPPTSTNAPSLQRSATAPTDAVVDLPFDRAAALAAIEYRRGRAKSFAAGSMTPRKQMLEGMNLTERRDISAPTSLGGALVKGSGTVGRSAGRRMVGEVHRH